MNVKELKQKLENVPDNMDVFIMQTVDEYGHSLAEHAYVKEIEFKAPEIPKKEWATEKCFVIDDMI